MDNDNISKIKNLLNFFNFAVRPKGGSRNSDKILFTKPAKIDNEIVSIKDKLSPSARNMFDYWESNIYNSRENYEQRINLWKDMDLAFFNSAIIGKAVKYTAGEALQADTNNLPVQIEAKRKQRNFINDWFDEISLFSKIYQLAEDIVLYGNAMWLFSFGKQGIDEIIHVDIYDLTERIEFNARQIEKELKMKNGTLQNLVFQNKRMDSLIDSIKYGEEFSADYKSYLLGYQIGDRVIPPWRGVHFRNATSRDPFYPFGMPFYINSIAPYRAYDAGLSLQIAARGARFPIDKYSVDLGEGTTNPTTKLQKVTEFINQLENSGMRGSHKEGIGIGERIVTLSGLFDFDQITPNIDIGDIADLELLKEDLIESTDIPVGFFIADKGSFGSSAIELVQQSKPFARRVYVVQSIIMQGISEAVKIHMIQSGQFAKDQIDFVLSMPYPESQVNNDIISSQRDLLSLSSDILDNLADKVGGTSANELPIEVIRQVYSKVLPYDQSTIDNWINEIQKDRDNTAKELEKRLGDDDEGDTPTIEFGSTMKGNKSSNVRFTEISLKECMNELKIEKTSQLKEVISEVIHDRKQKHYREGSVGGRHYFSSKNKSDNSNFYAEKLIDIDKKIAKDILKEMKVKPLKEDSETYKFGESSFEETDFNEITENLEKITNENISMLRGKKWKTK